MTDPALHARAVHGDGAGGLCQGQVFEVGVPVRVYRVWSRGSAASRLGHWWTLTPPEPPRTRFRETYAICPEHEDLDATVTCMLTAGARVVVGTVQSATCAGGVAYPASAAVKVYVAVEDAAALAQCTESRWP